MPLKAIMELDVDQSKFDRLKELTDKYLEKLQSMPATWKAANAQQADMLTGFQKMTAAILAQQDIHHRALTDLHRGSTEVDRQAKSWHSIAREAKDTAAAVGSITRSFVKWSGIATLFTGLLGGGSLWGFSHLAGGVSGLRQQAAGIGVTPGQLTAFGVDFGRFVGDPQGMLSRVAAALTDPTNPAYKPIAALLGNVQGQNAAQVSAALLRKLPQLFRRGANDPTLGTVAGAYGLTDILSVEDIKKYLSAGPEERRQQERAYQGDVNRFNLDPRTLRVYQDFTTQLERAGNSIWQTFVVGLEPLVRGPDGGPLGQLSKAALHLVEAFMGAAKDKHWIDDLSQGLERFSSWIGTPEFDDKVKSFVDYVGIMASAAKAAAEWILWATGKSGDVTNKGGFNYNPAALSADEKLLLKFGGGEWAGPPGTNKPAPSAWSWLNRPGYDIAGNPLETITTAGGHSVTVSAAAAKRFRGFLEGLEQAGAPITSLGGYNARTIAGTNKWSEHAFGRAIDVDQSGRDKVTKEFRAWALANADTLRQLEEQYGIKSGGDFSRPDFGHFELKDFRKVLRAADRAPNYDTGQISKSLATEIAKMRREGVDYRNQTMPQIAITKSPGADVNVSMQQLSTAGGGFSGPLP